MIGRYKIKDRWVWTDSVSPCIDAAMDRQICNQNSVPGKIMVVYKLKKEKACENHVQERG